MDEQQIKQAVRQTYGDVAASGVSGGDEAVRRIAESFGYSADELAAVPDGAHMGLSCGNPTAMASLRPGEVVVDLGSGGGIDVFLAASKVGPTGRAVGIDMSPEMIERARANATTTGLANVEFHLAEIDALPLDDASVDCVISNCVLNLVPDKPRAFGEIARVLRPGGRLAASDIALKQPLPEELLACVAAYTGCVSGAIPIETYRQLLAEARFDAIQIIDSQADLNVYAAHPNTDCCSPQPIDLPMADEQCRCSPPPSTRSEPNKSALHRDMAELITRHDLNEYAASVKVFAVRGT